MNPTKTADNIYSAPNSAAEVDAWSHLNESSPQMDDSQQLREFSPKFLDDLLHELGRQAAKFSADVKDRRFRIFAATGPGGPGETLLAFGEHAGRFFPTPARIIQVSEQGNQLVQRTYTSQVNFSEVALPWKVVDGQIKILKKDEAQTLESFAADMIEKFLRKFAK